MTEKPSYRELEQRLARMTRERDSLSGKVLELKHKTEQLSGIVDHAVVGFYQSTPEGAFTWVNTAFARMLGYERDELLGSVVDIREQFFPDAGDRDRFKTEMIKRGRVENFSCRVRHRDGHFIWISEYARQLVDADGKTIAYEGMVMDVSSQKAAEQARLETENFLSTLINALPVPVFHKDRQGRYQGFNQAFENFFGKKENELVGKGVFDISPPHLAQIYHAMDEELFNSGGTQHYESQVQNARGQTRDVVFDKSVYRNNDGEVCGLIGTVMDITNRKEAERALSESEARFRSIFDDANDGILVANTETKQFILANNVICEMLGYSREELYGLSVLDIHPKERLEEALAAFESGARQEARTAEGLPVQRKDGSFFYADINASPILVNGEKVLVGIFRDITRRRHMQAALKKSEERFREMADLLPVAVVETDIDINITYVNRLGMEMFGYGEGDADLGINGLDLISPEDRDKALERLSKRIEKRPLGPTEYRMLTKAGKKMWIFLNAAPVTKNGRVTGFRLVLMDVSERKRIEKERERLILELKKALAEIKTLKGIVPICSSCKKIRDDKGYWNILETFIQEHSEASFSHGLCPECSEELYGHHGWYKDIKNKK